MKKNNSMQNLSDDSRRSVRKCEMGRQAALLYLQAMKSENPMMRLATQELVQRAVKSEWGENAAALFFDDRVVIEHLDGRLLEVTRAELG